MKGSVSSFGIRITNSIENQITGRKKWWNRKASMGAGSAPGRVEVLVVDAEAVAGEAGLGDAGEGHGEQHLEAEAGGVREEVGELRRVLREHVADERGAAVLRWWRRHRHRCHLQRRSSFSLRLRLKTQSLLFLCLSLSGLVAQYNLFNTHPILLQYLFHTRNVPSYTNIIPLQYLCDTVVISVRYRGGYPRSLTRLAPF